MSRTLLVTVGSTRFDGLIESIQQDHNEFVEFIGYYSIDKIVIQHGRSKAPVLKGFDGPVEIVDYFEPQVMAKLLRESTVIISHGGAGTIFEVLRSRNRNLEAFIVVENESLMDGHQSELIDSLLELNCPIKRANLNELFDCKTEFGDYTNTIPAPDNTMLVSLINSYLRWSLLLNLFLFEKVQYIYK